jgi:hypothetical protein
MEYFIAQNLLEYGLRPEIVFDNFTIDRETSGGGLFRQVQECEQRLVGFVFNAEIVQAMTRGRKPACRRAPGRMRRPRTKQSGGALAEQIPMVEFIDRVGQIQPAQQRILGDLGGAQNVTAATGFDFGEGEQLAHTPARVAPNPPVNRPQHPIDAC